MADDHYFTIHGLRWLFRFTRLRGQAAGWAYLPDPKNPKSPRKVLIDDRLRGRSKLETIVHECIHISFPSADEAHVTEGARDIARVLYALGYRLDEGKAP